MPSQDSYCDRQYINDEAERVGLRATPGARPNIAKKQDREIIFFDGRVLITSFVEKNAATRYGNWVYVRCETGP